jgi:hypothetical protein
MRSVADRCLRILLAMLQSRQTYIPTHAARPEPSPA